MCKDNRFDETPVISGLFRDLTWAGDWKDTRGPRGWLPTSWGQGFGESRSRVPLAPYTWRGARRALPTFTSVPGTWCSQHPAGSELPKGISHAESYSGRIMCSARPRPKVTRWTAAWTLLLVAWAFSPTIPALGRLSLARLLKRETRPWRPQTNAKAIRGDRAGPGGAIMVKCVQTNPALASPRIEMMRGSSPGSWA